MRFNTITSKLLVLIIGAFLLTYICVLVVADHRLTEIMGKHQDEMYTEKLDVIFSKLSKDDERLQKTGLVEAYSKGFKLSAISNLEATYYHEQSQEIYPFIIDANNKVIMYPNGEGDYTPLLKILERDKESIKAGSVSTYFGQKNWYMYKRFAPWDWVVAYVVPIEIRYKEARTLRNMFIFITSVVTIAMLIVIAVVITKLTEPIKKLTKISAEIAKGNLDEEIDLRAGDEVGILAQSFDIMRKAIKQQINDLNSEVTERKEAEDNLRVTLNSIGDGVIATDINGKITRMNPVAERLCGYSFDEAEGEFLLKIYGIIDSLTRKPRQNPVDEVIKNGEMIELSEKTVLISKSGEEWLISDSASPIRDDDGAIIGVVLVFRDVTKEYKLQDQIRQIQKMEAIGQLAGGIAHDFNNMLGGIIGAAELINMFPSDDPKCKEYNAMIIDTAERAAELTKKLLTFARKQHLNSSEIDAHEALLSAVSILEKTIDPRIVIEYKLDAEDRTVIGDMSQLQGVFLNLGINSSHVMPDGGSIFISTKVITLDHLYCESSQFEIKEGKYIEIEFRDTGSGIPAQDLVRIFEPFFTTKSEGKGTGIGLAVVYGTIQQHNGAISVYSEVGVGTVFHVLLPLAGQEGNQFVLPNTELYSGSGTILVVDDELVMRDTASVILQSLGYNVIVADNGSSGLELFKSNHEEIDLVLLDMIMPVMNGRDCFKEMKKIDPNVCVVLASGFARDEDIEEMEDTGLCGFINKPYRSSELSETLHRALSAKR